MNSEHYKDVLEKSVKPYFHRFHDASLTFMHDNAAVHASRATKDWFVAAKIPVLDWPAISPDMNPIENIWGIMAREVYADGKHYENIRELENAVKCSWNNVSDNIIKNLLASMPKRMAQVYKNNRNVCDY